MIDVLRARLEGLNVGDASIQQIGGEKEVDVASRCGGTNRSANASVQASQIRRGDGKANKIASKVRADQYQAYPDAQFGAVGIGVGQGVASYSAPGRGSGARDAGDFAVHLVPV